MKKFAFVLAVLTVALIGISELGDKTATSPEEVGNEVTVTVKLQPVFAVN